MTSSPVLSEVVAETLAAHGVRRLFGIPGGGSSLDIIEAAVRRGLDFVLTRTETGAALMAAVTGELTGSPGVVLTGVGPGATSAVNGIAYAYLERAPVVLLTDGPASSLHQALDQNALYRPVTKRQGRLYPEQGRAEIDAAIQIALTLPRGPVQLDLTAQDAATPVEANAAEPPVTSLPDAEPRSIEQARALLARSRRPLMIVGLEARDHAEPVRRFADNLGCPVLQTYKAKGTVPESRPSSVGLFTGAAAEAHSIDAADLVILVGLDQVEIIPSTWRNSAKVLDLCAVDRADSSIPTDCRLVGPLGASIAVLLPAFETNDWTPAEVADLRHTMLKKLTLRGGGHTAQSVIEAAAEVAPPTCRLTVDAGAHMFATMAFWPAQEPFGVLKSNGLSTMGFALPAAIASALHEPERPVLAVTGDGGLMMCLSELVTAVEERCRIVVLALNDASLSLIDIKQQRQQRASQGVRFSKLDLAGVAKALGCNVWRVGHDASLAPALIQAFASDRPALIDVTIDPGGYAEQLAALRG